MSLAMQWVIIPPLVGAFYFVVWKSQAAEVEYSPEDHGGESAGRMGYARQVISTFGFVEWSSLTLVTLYLFFLVVNTAISLV